jgi:hypothetical protein
MPLGAMIHWMIRGKSPPPAVGAGRRLNDPYVPLAREAHDDCLTGNS